MSRVAIFIDGAYVDFMLRAEFPGVKIDYGKLVAELTDGREADVLRAYYYCCPPYQGHPPTSDESERYGKFQRFERSLQQIPRFEVKRGELAFRGYDLQTKKPRFEQKRVDLLLGVDLVSLAAKGRITDAIIIAGDSDFLPAIEMAKDDGVLVRLVHGAAPHQALKLIADECLQMDSALLAKVSR